MHVQPPFTFMPVAQRLAGKRVLVTGAGGGLGRAAAERCALEGARVGLLDLRADTAGETAAAVRAAGGDCLILPADVAAEAQVEAAVATLVAAWGALDVLVAVAGIELWQQGDDKVHLLERSVWQRILDVNLTGMFLSCKHAVRAMLAGGAGGSIIITGSPTGLYGHALGEHAYSASKAGCHGLVRVMANEYAADGIRVNCVVPGFMDTSLNAPVFAHPEALAEATQRIPLRRAGHPAECAGLYAWLASDDAAYTTGAFFVVDGGETAV